MANKLTAEQKLQLNKLVASDGEIPYEFLPLLFPRGDGNFGEREKNFRHGFHRLEGLSWTAFAQKTNPEARPPSVAQAAWSWRREIYHVHFGCVFNLEKAYRYYRAGRYSDSNGFSEISRILIRYSHLVGGLTLHNALEDRIAQLANAFSASPLAVRQVDFRRVFSSPATAVPPLPKTWRSAKEILADADWQRIHDLANEVKHRWTDEFVPHLPKPEDILARVRSGGYVQFTLAVVKASFLPANWTPPATATSGGMEGIIEREESKAMANLDAICELAQKSHNALIDLSLQLDPEIDWESQGLQAM